MPKGVQQRGLDAATPTGRAMFQMMGVFAEFERRAMICERALAGPRAGKRASYHARPAAAWKIATPRK